MKSLNESYVPKAVLKPNLGTDSIQKCLWILHKKFNFQTTKKLYIKYFQCLKHSLSALLDIKIPMLISAENKLSIYHHVVVVWREMIFDYESMYTYSLTDDTLRQVCGFNTTFQQISCRYGIFPLTICKALQANQNIQNWGIAELYRHGSSIRKYFYWR
jgi:hypothetical protein